MLGQNMGNPATDTMTPPKLKQRQKMRVGAKVRTPVRKLGVVVRWSHM